MEMVGKTAIALLATKLLASYVNPTIIRQTGPNTYSGVGNNNTFRGAGGGIQPKLGTSNPSGGWVWNNNKGTLHKCTALGICTD